MSLNRNPYVLFQTQTQGENQPEKLIFTTSYYLEGTNVAFIFSGETNDIAEKAKYILYSLATEPVFSVCDLPHQGKQLTVYIPLWHQEDVANLFHYLGTLGKRYNSMQEMFDNKNHQAQVDIDDSSMTANWALSKAIDRANTKIANNEALPTDKMASFSADVVSSIKTQIRVKFDLPAEPKPAPSTRFRCQII